MPGAWTHKERTVSTIAPGAVRLPTIPEETSVHSRPDSASAADEPIEPIEQAGPTGTQFECEGHSHLHLPEGRDWIQGMPSRVTQQRRPAPPR
eukprot:10858865-Alexandrium_andersonii.AAC.1